MSKLKYNLKRIFKESVFGALFTLWTAPIDNSKLAVPKAKEPSAVANGWFPNDLIIGHRP